MVKLKRRHLTDAVNNNSTPSASANISNVSVDSNFSGDDSWVVVKKQRINILIPSLPGNEQSTMLDVDLDDKPGSPPGNSINSPSWLQNENPENPPEACPADVNNEQMPLVPETSARSGHDISSPSSNVNTIAKPSNVHSRKPKNEDQPEVLRALSGKENCVVKFPVRSRVYKPSRSFRQFGLHIGGNLPETSGLLDRMMRASNLERKIVKAGGLSNWLSSLGLHQFVTIFHGKKVSKFQLASLSMQKLKDMGAHAVGPRRKLIHAIQCLCEPYCFHGLKS